MRLILFILALLLIPSLAHAQASLLPDTLQQFTDALGVPIASGFICATVSGTSTNLATYPTAADANAGTNANSNPVLLDSAGRGNIWLATGTYRIVLLNPVGIGSGTCNGTTTGSAVKTVDGVAGTGSALGTNNTWTGINTFSNASNVFVGASLTVKNNNNILDCNAYAGATAADKVAVCVAALPSTGGTADARGIQGTASWASNPFTGVTKPIDFWCSGTTITLSATVTIPANVTLHFGQGCIFTGSSTLTINGRIDNPQNTKIFTTTLPVVLNTTVDYPDWFGALHDGSTDDAAAIQAAITAFYGKTNPYGGTVGPAGGGWSTVSFSPGVYVFKTAITETHSGIHMRGSGFSSTILRFQPASTATAISFSAGADELHDLSFEDCTLDATGSSLSVVKKGLYLYDVAEFSLRNAYIRDFSDNTHASIALELHGREHIIVENVQLFGSRPLYIGADPNTATEGLDRSMFHNVLLGALTTIAEGNACVTDKPVVELTEADALLADVKWDGVDFICGSYSFYWSNTNAKVNSYDVSFKDVRNESHGTLPEWAFYINPPSGNPVQNLTFDTVALHAGDKGGWYLRNVVNGSMNSVTYATSASIAPVDADATASMTLTNANWNLHSGLHNALNGWCGVRFNEDNASSVKTDGNFVLRGCSAPDIVLETFPAGTTYTVSAASCSASLLTYTVGANSFEANGQITVTGITPSGLNGTFAVVSANTSATVTVVNDACPLTYSSGGTNAMVYGPPSFISTAPILSGAAQGDLQLRTDGAATWIGSGGTGKIKFPSATGGILFSNATSTPIGGAGTIGLGASIEVAGAGGCPATVTINGAPAAPTGCLVITVAGTSRSIPFF